MICASCGHEAAEPFKFCPECGAAAAPTEAAREQRKVVTVLFCDVTGSTGLGERLDPEPLRALLARYFERMRTIVERHGGTVEKFIGDAVMAVFGVPVLHEDDALRAVKAAAEMRAAFPELEIEGRIGITTGEVVTGTAERLVTGDAVNVAARLEQAAQPGEILLGADTLQLVRHAVTAEPVEPLELKGKSETVAAYRLLAVTGESAPRHEAPMVGRERQRRLLADAWDAVVAEGSAQLFTVLGPAGVGKSRLVAEFVDEIGGGARVLRARCLPYGDGITYWPVVEVLLQLLGRDPAARLEELGVEESAVLPVLALLGKDQRGLSASEETAWAVRKVLEAAAMQTSLVVVLDDIHWGAPTFLDLVEHIADWSRGAPILLLCMARPELLDRRPGWAGGKVNATTVLLEPLSEDETGILIESLLADGEVAEALRDRILAASEGNPLFVEEMVALLRASGGGEVTVPPSIQALLAARLDQLEPRERSVLERGAVEGKIFHRGAVEALAPEETAVPAQLMALVRKELVRPERTLLAGDDAFRFRHLLIRDVAYDSLPKAVRAELHERFAAWLERRGADLIELDEILGYHLEQSYRYRAEIGVGDEHVHELGRRAGELLGTAGERALARFDMRAAATLLERALAVLPSGHARSPDLRLALGDALSETDHAAAVTALTQLIDDSVEHRDSRTEWRARSTVAWVQLLRGEITGEAAEEVARRAIETLTEIGDEAGLARAWRTMAQARNAVGDVEGIGTAMQCALAHAQRAGDLRLATEASFWIEMSSFYGATPVLEAVELCEGLLESASTPTQEANASFWLAAVRGLAGQVDEARTTVARIRTFYAEIAPTLYGGSAMPHARLALLAGDVEEAERVLRDGERVLARVGENGYRSATLAMIADALQQQGRDDEAWDAIEESRAITAPDDAMNFGMHDMTRARLLARRGELDEAIGRAEAAVAVIEPTGNPDWIAEALITLAEVLQQAGRTPEASGAAARALTLYEAKGVVPAIETTRALLAELSDQAAGRLA